MAALQQSKASMGRSFGRQTTVSVNARLSFAKPSKAAKAGNYVCVDCGYLYTEEKTKGPFPELPNSYSCPVCGANKKRFRTLSANTSRSNDNKTMSKRRDAVREELEARGESVGEDASFLLVTAASAAVFIGAVYYFTVLAR